MSDYSRKNTEGDSIEATRQKKMEEFRRNADLSAIRGEYDESPADRVERMTDPESLSSFASEPAPSRRRKNNDEINSYSDFDTKKRIERDSKKALKQQKKEEKKIEKSKAKRNRRIFKLVWISMVIIVGVVFSQMTMVAVNDMLAIGRSDNPREVDISIPSDPKIEDIADMLYQKGVIEKPQFFIMYAQLTSDEEDFRQGDYKISTGKDYEAIINFLQSNVNRTDIATVQITEGMNLMEIAQTLHESGVITDIQEFLAVCSSDRFDEDYPFLKEIKNADKRYYKLEGYLFPDTYDFYLGEDPAVVVEKFLDNYENKIIDHKERYFGNSKKSTLEQEAAKSGYSTDEILTIASIIQAEAANRDDMYYISSILHNRLEYGSAYGVAQLNCDCTVYYPYRKEADVPADIKATFASTYNTNNFDGLPAGPICNPGAEAIKAALNPYDTDYLYFCHDTPENGSTPFYAEDYEDHQYNLSIIG